MSAPRGKGIFLRAPGAYPRSTPVDYARSIRADWAAVFSSGTPDFAARQVVLAYPGGTYLYEHPGAGPSTSRAEALALGRRAQALTARGVILDREGGWSGNRPRDVAALAEDVFILKSMGLDVGFTSYPAWQQRRAFAAALRARGVTAWAAVQLYPMGPSRLTPEERARFWNEWVQLGYEDVIAAYGAWGLSPCELQRHLEEPYNPASGILWTGAPAATGATRVVMEAWSPGPFGTVRSRALELLGRGVCSHPGLWIGIGSAILALIVLAVVFARSR